MQGKEIMAHFAQLDVNNVVSQVIVVHNNELLDDQDSEREELGIAFCRSLFGAETLWVQTSYNANFRKNYAGIGYTYDAVRDAFISPKPYPSWILNEDTCQWQAPVPYPNDGSSYAWNEGVSGEAQAFSWVEITYGV
jgi:hypothetical protein